MLKKLMSMLLALSLVLGMTGVAFADDESKGTITVKNFVNGTTKVNVYQILKYNYDDVNKTYNYVDFTDAAYKTAFVTAIDNDAITAASTASEIMLYITNKFKNDATFAAKLAGELATVAANPKYTEASGTVENGALKITDVPMGYYLIVDSTDTTPWEEDPKAHYTSSVMLQPMKPDVVVVLKSEHHKEIEKDIVENQGSYSIGSEIEFVVKATVPNEVDPATGLAYAEFDYVVVDTMTKGLTLVADSVVVKVNNVESTGYTNVAPEAGDTFTLKLSFDETQVQPMDTIVITYKAVVNEDAEIENHNDVFDFGHDTDKSLTGDRETFKTYGIDITKVNEYQEKLEGVGFKLYQTEGTYISVVEIAQGQYLYTTTPAAEDKDKVVEEMFTDENGKLVVFGLAAGTYYLEETTTLPGYNPLQNDIEMVIKESTQNEETKVVNGYWTEKVENHTGIELPSTGGIGTAAFTALGSAIMACAVAFMFVSKKRFTA